MRQSIASRGVALAGLFLASGLAAAIAQDDGYANLPCPGDNDTGLYVALRGSMVG